MDFKTSVSTCFSKYAVFSGRARRSEYWWFYLLLVLIGFVSNLFGDSAVALIVVSVAQLALLVPYLAAGARRLHDTGRSGWWQLLWLIPIVGWIILIVWFATDGKPGENKYGPSPKEAGSIAAGYGQDSPIEPTY